MMLGEFFRMQVQKMDEAGRFATSRNYRKTMRSFSLFLEGRDLPLSQLSDDMIIRYNRYLAGRGVARNTMSFYNRILRAAYHKAVQDGYAPEGEDPFWAVYTGVDKTPKRALDRGTLRRILSLDLSAEPELALARDMFLFSFYARGMCFVDLVYLKYSNLCGNCLSYVRSKTGQRLKVKIESCMEPIMLRYRSQAFGDYVFPIIQSDDAAEAFKEYNYHLCRHNLMLKEIGRRAGTGFPLNSYAARHSWATLAREADVPIAVISEGMGHASEKTTRIYLAELDNTVVDSANRNVIGFLFQ